MILNPTRGLAEDQVPDDAPFVVVLGIAQDAGYPQAGCRKDCCRLAWFDPKQKRFATSIAIVDPQAKQRFLVDCTPDFRDQLRMLDEAFPVEASPGIDGIFLTHAHIGHYTGLMHLGREVMGTRDIPVFAMPQMNAFLRTNGPWSQLVKLKNIELRSLKADRTAKLNEQISITPILVPHRDEFSETVAFVIAGPNRRLLFLPDIDKWSRWERKIEEVVRGVDIAFVDGSFYADGEIPGRDMASIPHPFIEESILRFGQWPVEQRSKVRFIHLNHTNPALRRSSDAAGEIKRAGMSIAEQGDRVGL